MGSWGCGVVGLCGCGVVGLWGGGVVGSRRLHAKLEIQIFRAEATALKGSPDTGR